MWLLTRPRATTARCALLLALLAESTLRACPFCSPPGPTFTEEIGQSRAVVVARRQAVGNKPGKLDYAELKPSKFEILKVLKGPAGVVAGNVLEVFHLGDEPPSAHFYITAENDDGLTWTRPIELSTAAERYLQGLVALPPSGGERLAYFLPYLEHAEEALRADAYDEFAKAPYAELRALQPHMRREALLAGIRNPELPANTRRLYLTMLGICGGVDDLPLLESLIRTDDRKLKPSLDAVIGCWLTLRGADGVPLVEQVLLGNPAAEYIDVYAAVQAIRFHGEEGQVIPRERLAAALRGVLERPPLADLVIADLARWEDWSVVERLTAMFKQTTPETAFLRVPILLYLKTCPRPEAKQRLEALAALDPRAWRDASSPLPFAGRSKPPADAGVPGTKAN